MADVEGIYAALIGAVVPFGLAVGRAWFRAHRRRLAARLRIYRQSRIIADSLLVLTMRVEALEDQLGELEHLLRRPGRR